MKLAILISGRGSNMIALADYASQDDVPCEIVAVIADTDAPGLKAAKARGLSTFTVDANDYAHKTDHEAAIAQIIDDTGADNIFLAGYMRLLSSSFCTRFEHRLFNIHPSLLPRHKGLDTHARALKAGDEIHGCSVHLVSAGMDDGPVLAQREVSIHENDTPETLAERVLKEEHKLYSELLDDLITGLLRINQGQPNCRLPSYQDQLMGRRHIGRVKVGLGA